MSGENKNKSKKPSQEPEWKPDKVQLRVINCSEDPKNKKKE
jgi:hypothetical protein